MNVDLDQAQVSDFLLCLEPCSVDFTWSLTDFQMRINVLSFMFLCFTVGSSLTLKFQAQSLPQINIIHLLYHRGGTSVESSCDSPLSCLGPEWSPRTWQHSPGEGYQYLLDPSCWGKYQECGLKEQICLSALQMLCAH